VGEGGGGGGMGTERLVVTALCGRCLYGFLSEWRFILYRRGNIECNTITPYSSSSR